MKALRYLMRDAKKRKQELQIKLNNLKASSDEVGLDKIQVDDICYEARKVLDEIDYSDQFKSIRTLLDKVTIKKGGWVNICGHIPLFAQKLGDELKSRDSWTSECWKIYIIQCTS